MCQKTVSDLFWTKSDNLSSRTALSTVCLTLISKLSEYRLSLLINVRQTVDNAVLELRLSDLVQKRSETVFWHIETVELPLTEGYNPAERIIRFNHTQGVYRLAIVGMLDRYL